MADSLEGKVALVTGAGSGIGRATAIAFAREGAKVVIADADSQAARETVSLIDKEHGIAAYVPCSSNDRGEHETLVKRAVEFFGRLDFAFHNSPCPETIHAAGLERYCSSYDGAEHVTLVVDPEGRLGSPEEIAATIVRLCSNGASSMTVPSADKEHNGQTP